MDEIAIKVENIYKDFRLPHENSGSVKNAFVGLVQQIRKKRTYETQHALKDISLEIKNGEFFGIVGRNGSGKSTLLKILAGIYQPTKGNVNIRGKLVPFIELGVGFNPELSGRQNVYLNGALLGFSEKEIDRQYDEIVEFAELEKFMDQKLKNYSSGMQVRLAFSMAVRAKADILLIDEVLAVGDADFQRKCFNYFKQLRKENTTVVFVSHSMDAVREFCDRAVLIEKNRVVMVGETTKVADSYSQLFINDSPKGKIAANAKQPPDQRRGAGGVRAKSVTSRKAVYSDKDDTVSFTTTLEGFGPNEYLMTGLRIKNAAGQILQETNTWNEKVKIDDLPAGETCKVSWEFPNIYSDGEYIIDVYVYAYAEIIFDLWDDALKFEVRRLRRDGALVTPPGVIKVHDTKKE